MDKILVRRANVVIEVNPEDKQFYMDNGYSVVDKFGEVVESAMPVDPNALKVQIGELTKKLEEANKTIAKLKADLKNAVDKQSKQAKRKE